MASGEPAIEEARWSVDELIPFGKYILLDKISAGAIAAVYRAKIRGEAGFERLVTIKRILPQMAGDPEFVETFVREAKICARLNHSSICPIYELGKVGESLYMTLEWVAGKDLGAISRRLQKKEQVMPPLLAAWIASRLCDALDYAHGLKDNVGKRVGLLHQDVSPNNIVIAYEGEVKLIDFGIARASGRAQQTNVEALKQKLGYMSPELVLGTALDARSDVFAVGVVLYEMVTGRRLFAGGDDIATLKLVSSAAVPPPSALLEDTPDELEQIIMRALARDPDARWQSAGEMAQALSACIAAEDPTYGTRNVAEFMHALFAEDKQAEQRRQNDLIKASQNAKLIEERRRFFASPLGAAAVAKAEAARKLASNRPPPPPKPAGTLPPPAPPKAQLDAVHVDDDDDDDELTTYQPERRETKRQGPASALQPPRRLTAPEPAGSGNLKKLAPPEPAGTGKKPEAPEPAAAGASPAADPNEQPTAPIDAPTEQPTAPIDPGVGERVTAPDPEAITRAATLEELIGENESAVLPDEDELTTFRPERTRPAPTGTFQEAEAQQDAATLRPEGESPASELAAQPATAPPTPFEEEPTSYFEPATQAQGTKLLDALVAAQGPFEEEATQIFFNSESGVGLMPDVPDDEPTTIAPPTPLLVPAPGARRAASATSTGRLAPIGPLGTLGTGQHRPVQMPAPLPTKADAPLASWTERDRSIADSSVTFSSGPPASTRGPLVWVASALLFVAAIGVIWKTPVGIQLGLRKPPDGVIEIRTLPEVPASVRLDGIYRGRAPLRLEGVPSGDRTLTLEADGYEPVTRRVALEGGATVKENITLSPQPSAAAAHTP